MLHSPGNFSGDIIQCFESSMCWDHQKYAWVQGWGEKSMWYWVSNRGLAHIKLVLQPFDQSFNPLMCLQEIFITFFNWHQKVHSPPKKNVSQTWQNEEQDCETRNFCFPHPLYTYSFLLNCWGFFPQSSHYSLTLILVSSSYLSALLSWKTPDFSVLLTSLGNTLFHH